MLALEDVLERGLGRHPGQVHDRVHALGGPPDRVARRRCRPPPAGRPARPRRPAGPCPGRAPSSRGRPGPAQAVRPICPAAPVTSTRRPPPGRACGWAPNSATPTAPSITVPSRVPIRVAAARPAASTSSWSSGSPVIPAARLVTSETPNTSRPSARAAIASSTVDMPTRSAPSPRSIRISAGVSKCGPGSAAYTPSSRRRVGLPGQRPQPRRVEVGEVDEPGADQRRAGGQVEVVGDQHRLAGPHPLAQPAGRVGEHHGPAAGRGGDPDAVRHGGGAATLVQVGAAEEDQRAVAADGQRADRAAVPLRGRRGEPGQLRRPAPRRPGCPARPRPEPSRSRARPRRRAGRPRWRVRQLLGRRGRVLGGGSYETGHADRP